MDESGSSSPAAESSSGYDQGLFVDEISEASSSKVQHTLEGRAPNKLHHAGVLRQVRMLADHLAKCARVSLEGHNNVAAFVVRSTNVRGVTPPSVTMYKNHDLFEEMTKVWVEHEMHHFHVAVAPIELVFEAFPELAHGDRVLVTDMLDQMVKAKEAGEDAKIIVVDPALPLHLRGQSLDAKEVQKMRRAQSYVMSTWPIPHAARSYVDLECLPVDFEMEGCEVVDRCAMFDLAVEGMSASEKRDAKAVFSITGVEGRLAESFSFEFLHKSQIANQAPVGHSEIRKLYAYLPIQETSLLTLYGKQQETMICEESTLSQGSAWLSLPPGVAAVQHAPGASQ